MESRKSTERKGEKKMDCVLGSAVCDLSDLGQLASISKSVSSSVKWVTK